MRKLLGVFLLFACQVVAQPDRQMDSVFIQASVCIAQPGDVLYSCIGHSFIRMSCPHYNLDYCFSYEGESVRHNIATYLAGNLKMGMVMIPTQDFLRLYKEEGRGVIEYSLNLPLSQKKKLWRLLDMRVAQGLNLPYDYMERGCALSCFQLIKESMTQHEELNISQWPNHFSMTRRELVSRQLKDYPWTAFILYCLVGIDGDLNVTNGDKIVTPSDLLFILQQTTLNDNPLIEENGKELVPWKKKDCGHFFPSPLFISLMLLFITGVCIWKRWRFHEFALLAIQTGIGLFLFYLIFVSSLPCTDWNWLFVAFNPLPLLSWKWRKKWEIIYSVVLAVWLSVILVYPHKLVDNTYYVLTFTFILMYINNYFNKI